METSCKHVRKIPKELQTEKIDSIIYGGINNIIPAGPQFLFETNKDEIVPYDHWTPFANKKLEELIDNSYEIYFSTEFIYNGQHFGRMEITDSSNTKQWVNIILKDTNQALESCEFKKDLQNLKTRKLSCWLDNEKRPKLFKNQTTSASFSTFDLFRPNPLSFNTVEEKIANWTERNKEVSKEIEDFNEDSVSVLRVPDYQQPNNLNTTLENKSICTSIGRKLNRRESLMQEIAARKLLEESTKKLELKKPVEEKLSVSFLERQRIFKKREELLQADNALIRKNYIADGSYYVPKPFVPKLIPRLPISTKIDLQQTLEVEEPPFTPFTPDILKKKSKENPFLNQNYGSSSSDSSEVEGPIKPVESIKPLPLNQKENVYMPAGGNLINFTEGRGISGFGKW